MKKGIGCLILILVLLLVTVLQKTTGVSHGGTGLIGTGILVGLVMFGWSLIKSKKTTSSNEKSPNISQSYKSNIHSTSRSDIDNKEQIQSSSFQPIIKSEEINEEVIKEKVTSSSFKANINIEKINVEVPKEKVSDYSELSEIEKIERQHQKGIFSEEEKQVLINNILDKKQNAEIEKIKSNYSTVLNVYKDKFQHIYDEESIDLEDLQKQGIIDENTLADKLSLLKINIAKRIQKEIKFKCILGFEVFQGLGVEKIKPSFLEDFDEISGSVIEIVNSKEVRVKWSSNSISPPISLTKLKVTGVSNDILNDWTLSKDNFLLESEFDYWKNTLIVGDKCKDGIVFFSSKEEIILFKSFINSPIKSIRSNDFSLSSYDGLKSMEDNIWKIPNISTVKKFIKYCLENERFVPLQNGIWTTEINDSKMVQCVEANKVSEDIETTIVEYFHQIRQYGILTHTIK